MKKQLAAVLLIFALLSVMAGCSAANAAAKLDAAEEQVEEKLDTAQDSVERSVRKMITPAPTETLTASAANPTEAAPANSDLITKEGAEEIALKYLGLTRDQVKRLHTEYEIDDGICQYNVEFHSGEWEYEFEIHAETGKILSFDKDHKHD